MQLHRPQAGVAATFLAFVVVAALSATAAFAQARDGQSEARRVVILNATDPYLPAFIVVDGAMREAIRAGRSPRTDLYAETLDKSRFPQALLEQDTVQLLRKKYRDLKVDVVVAAATIALDFALRHRDAIWPGATIVFHSVSSAELHKRSLAPGTIGVPLQYDFGATLDLALKLRPGTRRVALVAGASESDRATLAIARASLERFAGRLEIEPLAGLSLADTLAAVRALPPDAVVLYVMMFRDGAGVPLVPRDVLERMAEVSNAPVFGVFETYLGHGIAAGSIASYMSQGRRAGELVARVLNGESPAAIGVQAPALPGCIADWRWLGRWGIDKRLLPADCEIRFREVTVWDRYHWQILAALAVILAQAGLIAALLIQRQQRRRAELAVQRHRGELFHATRLATMGELTASIAHEVNQPLGAILANVDAAEMLLESGKVPAEELRRILADVRRDDLRASDVIRRLRALLAKHETARERLQVHETVGDVLALLASDIRRRGVEVATAFDPRLPAVLGDRVQLQQVMLNLIVNAMDAVADAPSGRRRVSVRTRRTSDGEVVVSVADRGPGIPAVQLTKLFESFFTTKPRGMGLGLSIARTIVEAHGGHIWAESDGRTGTTLQFTLPAAVPATEPQLAERPT
ncbi:MAG: ABC transporter substrate binding protein [bacterium]